MKDEIRKDRDTLKSLLDRISSTNGEGMSISVEEALENAIEMVCQGASHQGKILFIGNGGSAAIASHMATDLWKNAGFPAIAFNDSVLLTCVSNDLGYEHVFEKPIEMFGQRGDVLIAISSSGQSENILRAVEAAKKKGLHIITLSGFSKDNPLRSKGEINFYVPSSQYGHVEVIHHSLCHCMVDMILKKKSQGLKESKIHE